MQNFKRRPYASDLKIFKTVDEVLEFFDCAHSETFFARFYMSNGTEHVIEVCSHCGDRANLRFVSKRKIKDIKALPEFDAEQRENRNNEKHRLIRELKERDFERESREHKAKYYEYLSSPRWAAKRSSVFHRDDFTCQDCGFRDDNGYILQAHHLTYENVFDEPLEDLITLCKNCHGKRHPEKVRDAG